MRMSSEKMSGLFSPQQAANSTRFFDRLTALPEGEPRAALLRPVGELREPILPLPLGEVARRSRDGEGKRVHEHLFRQRTTLIRQPYLRQLSQRESPRLSKNAGHFLKRLSLRSAHLSSARGRLRTLRSVQGIFSDAHVLGKDDWTFFAAASGELYEVF